MIRSLLIIIAGACATLSAQDARPFLSSLHVRPGDPVYTTYAAARERSAFILDEGYHLAFADTTRSLDFRTDNSGNWRLAFRMNGRIVSSAAEMHRGPVITASYPDMVRLHFEPFEGIRVEETFLVYTSRTALQDITITNTRGQSAELDILSALINARGFDGAHILRNESAIGAWHIEAPDRWTIDHAIPHADTVQDVFLSSDSPQAMLTAHCWDSEPYAFPVRDDPAKRGIFTLWGRPIHGSAERCAHDPLKQRFIAWITGHIDRVITERSPRWGTTEEAVGTYSQYDMELGLLGKLSVKDTIAVTYLCGATGTGGVARAPLANARGRTTLRQDILLDSASAGAIPRITGISRMKDGAPRLTWRRSGASRMLVYRRMYPDDGAYTLIARGIKDSTYIDKTAKANAEYGYFIVAGTTTAVNGTPSEEAVTLPVTTFVSLSTAQGDTNAAREDGHVLGFVRHVSIAAGETTRMRVVRSTGRVTDQEADIISEARTALHVDLDGELQRNEALFTAIPALRNASHAERLLYWSAFSLLRQCTLPPEGRCGFPYYVFSREPQWGWGHGGQVFHESLSMLAYALMDPDGAMAMQRVFRERQQPDGYINYRTGPYLDETLEVNGERTSSAPWYAWINYEICRLTQDTTFLSDMYASSARFHDWYVSHRDRDHDGLCEWGGDAVLESVRDARVAVWDQVAPPDELEAVDLNTLLCNEELALGEMAGRLGRVAEYRRWMDLAFARARRINDTMWDEETQFYYNIDLRTHTFSHSDNGDLKRMEIIGFLPLWAGITLPNQVTALARAVMDTTRFWRRFGVPSLSALDPYYNPKGYWNGPVWVQWNYLIARGLMRYGYTDEARTLAHRVAAGMIEQLRRGNTFWEFYSPDEPWGGYHQTYIWAGLIARLLFDVDAY